jgi:hypothetical protein
MTDESEHGNLSREMKRVVDAAKARVGKLANSAEWVLGRRTARVLGVVALLVVMGALLLVLLLTTNLWEGLNSKFGLLLMGFILTTIAGGLISSWLQRATWYRQTRVDLYRQRYEEGAQFLDDLSKQLGNRFFQMQRYLWIIEDANDDKLREIEADYFKTVTEWNSTFWMNRNKIRLLVGEAQAKRFLDYQDDVHPTYPRSIHYRFKETHNYVIRAKEGRTEIEQAQAKIDGLNYACTDFLEDLTTDYLKRTASLQLLKPPEESTRQEGRSPGDL